MRLLDVSGQTFGRLRVIERAANRAGGRHVAWRCECACGSECVVTTVHLRSGHTTSCGCYRVDLQRVLSVSHGHSIGHGNGAPVSPEYQSWCGAKRRCYVPESEDYPEYGGRGITMHPAWRENFAAFAAFMGPRPRGASLDRIDTNGNYEPGNCRWATAVEQRNNRRDCTRIAFGDEMLTLAEVARRVGVSAPRLYRLHVQRGISLYESIKRLKTGATSRPRLSLRKARDAARRRNHPAAEPSAMAT